MKKAVLCLTLFGALFAHNAHAADRKVMLPLANAMEANDAKSRLGETVKFYFGKQATPSVLRKIASDQTSQKTNAFGKSDEKACNWAFLSAMLALQKRANELGANAVINIQSNYNNQSFSSETEFECHAGAIMAGVALKADFVKVQEHK
jgi:uncharacterized protein YbjQ (UPF0145 family)